MVEKTSGFSKAWNWKGQDVAKVLSKGNSTYSLQVQVNTDNAENKQLVIKKLRIGSDGMPMGARPQQIWIPVSDVADVMNAAREVLGNKK